MPVYHAINQEKIIDTRLKRQLRQWAVYFSGATLLIALLVLIGWQFNIYRLRSPFQDQVNMNPVSAIIMGTAAIAFLLIRGPRAIYTGGKKLGRYLAIAIACFGLWKLLSLLGIIYLHPDRLLFTEKVLAETAAGRMSIIAPNAAFCFVLMGITLFLLPVDAMRTHRIIQTIALLIILVAFFSMVGYLYRVEVFEAILKYIPMSFLSATCFLLLSLACLLANPDKGVMGVITGAYAGSRVARFFIPATIIMPVILGWLRLQGDWRGVFTTEFGVTILVMAIITFFLLLIWNAIGLLNKWDAEKDLLEHKLRLFNEDLEWQVRERTERFMEVNEQLRQLSTHLVEVREQEQLRISREIHDELGQQLTGLKMDVVWLSKKVPADDNIKKKFTTLLELLDEMVKTIRRISTGLRPAALDDFGLLPAIEWHGGEFETRFNIPVQLSIPEQSPVIPAEKATAIFRVYQEALTNVARHSGATTVSVTISCKENTFTMTITDNGKGFETGVAGKKKTLGVLGMRERVISIGGQYEITGSPGKGTVVLVIVPL